MNNDIKYGTLLIARSNWRYTAHPIYSGDFVLFMAKSNASYHTSKRTFYVIKEFNVIECIADIDVGDRDFETVSVCV